MQAWGWRVPFLLAAPLGLVGLYIRHRADESVVFSATVEAASTEQHLPLRELLRHPRALAVAFAAAVLNAVAFYVVLSYLPTYLSEELGQDQTDGFLAATVALAAYVVLVVLTGAASDRFGRRRIIMAAPVLFAVASIPAFMLLDGASLAGVILIQVILGAILALNDGVLPSFLSEQFPTHVRLSGFALTFNCANAFFGGSAPMISTWLIGETGSTIAPAFYLIAASVVTGAAILLAPRHARIDR